jgi:hypothetical protein
VVAAAALATVTRRAPQTASSLEVSRPYSVSSRGAAACRPGLPRPVTCAFGLSRPLDAFIRPAPPRPCFMPDPLLGFIPSELCSSRTAVRPSSRRPALLPFLLRETRRPRLQGFAPCESRPRHGGGLDRHERLALLDFCPPGCAHHRPRTTFVALPLVSLSVTGRRNDRCCGSPGYCGRWAGRRSRDRRRPSWASLPSDPRRSFETAVGSGVASLGPGVRRRPLPDRL